MPLRFRAGGTGILLHPACLPFRIGGREDLRQARTAASFHTCDLQLRPPRALVPVNAEFAKVAEEAQRRRVVQASCAGCLLHTSRLADG